MNFLEKISVASKALRAIVLKKKTLLAAMFNITRRCNLQCGYCGVRERKIEELNTQSVFNMLEELSAAGVKFIKICGGEPLVRSDLGDIIDFCKSRKMTVSVNSNGTLVNKYLFKIKNVDELQLTLDGPREVNDAIRGRGVHDKVIEAIEMCKYNKINILLTTVISKYNISYIPYILGISKKYRVGVYFQPVDQNLSTNSCRDINSLFGPDEKEYKRTISYIIEEKLRGHNFISSSTAGLRYLYHWPKPEKINCLLNLVSLTIEPDGKIFVCSCFPNYEKYLVSVKGNLKKTFDSLSLPYPCNRCWGGSTTEFNLLGNFGLDTILGMYKRL